MQTIGGGAARLQENRTARQTIWHGTNRRAILLGTMSIGNQQIAGVNGLTGAGGVFSRPNAQFGEKSMFNKEKWLPACQELPFKISHMCCTKMKKEPLKRYAHESGRVPIIATLAQESRVRKQAWIRHGCNAFDSSSPSCQPMSFWTEQDVLEYIVKYNVKICDVYGDVVGKNDITPMPGIGCKLHCTGCDRTGCVYCMFGAHSRGDTRFLELAKLSPRQFEFAMGGGQWVDNPDYDATAPKYDGDWRNWNPEKIWVPSKQGLGLKYVIEQFNTLYPDNKIQLP